MVRKKNFPSGDSQEEKGMKAEFGSEVRVERRKKSPQGKGAYSAIEMTLKQRSKVTGKKAGEDEGRFRLQVFAWRRRQRPASSLLEKMQISTNDAASWKRENLIL